MRLEGVTLNIYCKRKLNEIQKQHFFVLIYFIEIKHLARLKLTPGVLRMLLGHELFNKQKFNFISSIAVLPSLPGNILCISKSYWEMFKFLYYCFIIVSEIKPNNTSISIYLFIFVKMETKFNSLFTCALKLLCSLILFYKRIK